MAKNVLITGATGTIATLVMPALLKNGLSVRAFVRNARKAESLKKLGVDVHIGDLADQESINQAAQGMDAVLSITVAGTDAVAHASAITKAAQLAGVKHLVRISATKAAPDAPTENGRFHYQSDEECRASGVPVTILRPHFFMQGLLLSVPTILAQGNMYWGFGQGKLGMVDVRDIADCAVSLLTNGGHEGQIYHLTGPSAIDFSEVAAVISTGIGKPVRYVPLSIEEMGVAMRNMGFSEWRAQMLMDYAVAYRAGWGDYTTHDVEIITGHKPRSFQQFFDEVLSHAFNQPVKADITAMD